MPEERIDKLHIRLRVYDTEIPVRVFREEEQLYRDAAKLITDTINAYHNRVSAETSEKTVMYMALIDIALRYQREIRSPVRWSRLWVKANLSSLLSSELSREYVNFKY